MALMISWESTYENWVAAQRLHRWSNLGTSSSFVFAYVLVPLFGLLPLSQWLIDHHAGDSQDALAQLPWAAGFVAWTVLIWATRLRAYRRAYRNSWPSNVKERVNTLVLSDSGIHAITPGVGDTNLQWSAFCRVVENKRMLLIYMSKTKWLNIPQTALTAEQRAELKALLAAHIGGHRC
jgi:hypothetical protein